MNIIKNSLLLLFLVTATACTEKKAEIKEVKKKAKKANKNTLIYHYNDTAQTFNYSRNWDFDNDGYADSLYLVGDRGAHIDYELKIILSSTNISYEFPLITIDDYARRSYGIIGAIEELKKASFYPPPTHPEMVVHDFDKDVTPEIYIHLRKESYYASKEELDSLGIHSPYILIDFEDNKPIIENFLSYMD